MVLPLAGSFLFAPVNLKERILKYEGPLLFEEVRVSRVCVNVAIVIDFL